MNRGSEFNTEELLSELNRLRITTDNITRLLTTVPQDRQRTDRHTRRPPYYQHTHPVVRDREGTEIIIGDQVLFLTRGLFSSARGTIYKISGNGRRITARDLLHRPVSRAPHNVRVLFQEDE